MDTFTYDLRVRDCTREQLASYARAAAPRPGVGIQPLDAPPGGAAGSYRVVVRPDAHGADAATTIAVLAWMLSAAGRLLSVRPRS